jgi:hypothetical protein
MAKEPAAVLRHREPCKECPWRRKHPAGWLGGYSAEDFVNQVQFDGPPVPCHLTIPPGGTMADSVSMCAGALIFMKNSCKSAQHPDYGDALEKVERSPDVFQWPHEFLAHHKDPEAWFNRVRDRVADKMKRAKEGDSHGDR